jgi:hypothetical protein
MNNLDPQSPWPSAPLVENEDTKTQKGTVTPLNQQLKDIPNSNIPLTSLTL